ncbi:putative phage-associated protein [Skermanella aerolata]|uniref:Panacea domain-containing protein n=1 Tax=Skermanella aerolata TaxID=393310 RepID=UPI003D19395F
MHIADTETVSGKRVASSAAAVANEFLALGRLEPSAPPIDQMKLQKLLFYAHAWHLALHDQALFEEDFEAWPWGPVVRDIYSQTRKYGKNPVSEELMELQRTGDNVLDYTFVIPHIDVRETKEFIRQIWDVHKSYSGVQLSNSTHAPGEPWTIIRDRYGNLDGKPMIPNKLIEDIFRKKIENAEQSHKAAI